MTIVQTIILGIVEGVTEFLPVSSTGHLILTGKLLGIANSNFTKSFNIAIQLGAILAVVALYWRRFIPNGNPSNPSGQVWKKVLVAFIPTAVVGFLLYKILKSYLLGNAMVVVWALAIGGVALIAFELWHKKRVFHNIQSFGNHGTGEMTYKNAFLVGISQSLAIIPGVSRSAATIVSGLALGISREKIVEFSFLLAVPTMAAATAYDLYKSAGSFEVGDFWILALGFVISFIVALLSIKWLLAFVKKYTFISFGVYRIFAALIFWFLVVR